jgi:transcription elongation factor Elf1
MLSNDPELFSCPYCGSDNYLSADPSGGRRQKFVVDCEICCQPIAIELNISGESAPEINARRENE